MKAKATVKVKASVKPLAKSTSITKSPFKAKSPLKAEPKTFKSFDSKDKTSAVKMKKQKSKKC